MQIFDSFFMKYAVFRLIRLIPTSFCLFSFFLHDKYSINTTNDKSIDGVLGTRTRGGGRQDGRHIPLSKGGTPNVFMLSDIKLWSINLTKNSTFWFAMWKDVIFKVFNNRGE